MKSWSSMESTHKSLSKRLRYLETLLSHFQKCFKVDYLPSLREHHKVNNIKEDSLVAVGDIIHLYKETLLSIGLWEKVSDYCQAKTEVWVQPK